MHKLLKIHIKCFQKHKDLTLNFSENINVISGLTDTGKSCCFRAISWLYNCCNMSESDYRTEGTKETSVKGWLNNGFQVERIRSNSINRYILSKEGTEDKVFDSFGKVVPEEIAKVFEFSTIDIDNESINLNFANQDQLNFILDEKYSDGFKAKLFNKLTGNELLDKIFKQLNKESLRFVREIRDTEENVKKQEEQLAEYSQKYKALKKKLNLVKTKYEDILAQREIYEHLKELSDKITSNKENKKALDSKIAKIKIVSEEKIEELSEKAKELKQIQNLAHDLESTNNALESIEKQKNNIKIVEFNEKQLISYNETLQKLNQLNEQLDLNTEKDQTIAIDKKMIKDKLKDLEQELKKIWDEQRVCPLCGKEK